MPWSRPLTKDDLDTMPDDGHRYELLDGTLLVRPAPVPIHQTIVLRVARSLQDAQPPDLQSNIAPLDDRNLPAAPVLAVEVLSPSTQRIDRFLKHSRYAAAGVEHYWIIDPDGPSLVAYALSTTGTYDEVARAHGDETDTASAPFDVLITPKQLVAEG